MEIYKTTANVIINFIVPLNNEAKKNKDYQISAYNIYRIDPTDLASIAFLKHHDIITMQTAKALVETMWYEWSGRSILQILREEKLFKAENKSDLENIIKKILETACRTVEDYHKGKVVALQHLIGLAMKKLPKGTNGKSVKEEIVRQLSV